jgi:hypothetical protein
MDPESSPFTKDCVIRSLSAGMLVSWQLNYDAFLVLTLSKLNIPSCRENTMGSYVVDNNMEHCQTTTMGSRRGYISTGVCLYTYLQASACSTQRDETTLREEWEGTCCPTSS